MTSFLAVLILVTVFCAWIAAMCWLGWVAIDQSSVRAGIATFVVFAVPLAAGIAFIGSDDPYPNTLCVRGHQEWVVHYNGKTTTRSKQWFCDQWEMK